MPASIVISGHFAIGMGNRWINMARCIVCGKQYRECLCMDCKGKTDLVELSERLLSYRYGHGEPQLWDEIAEGMEECWDFARVHLFAISEDIPSPKREYLRIDCIASGNGNSMPKASRAWLFEKAEEIRQAGSLCMEEGEAGSWHGSLSIKEENRVMGLLLEAFSREYRFEEAEEVLEVLLERQPLFLDTYEKAITYLLQTRRYAAAGDMIDCCEAVCRDDARTADVVLDLRTKRDTYLEAKKNGKGEYLPRPREGVQEVRQHYVDFLKGLGIEATLPKKGGNVPDPIPKDQYPQTREIRDAGFSDFVAYDFETTGLSTRRDEIIEIGAVKVLGGKVVETGEYTFQSFVKPFKKTVSEEVRALTGISRADVDGAKKIWDVVPEFAAFVQDLVLVGYNNIRFDSKFLERAGRYGHIVFENPQFDVQRYASELLDRIGDGVVEEEGLPFPEAGSMALPAVAKRLGIPHPHAHRALADALTTARVFLALREQQAQKEPEPEDLDGMLGDLDSWG